MYVSKSPAGEYEACWAYWLYSSRKIIKVAPVCGDFVEKYKYYKLFFPFAETTKMCTAFRVNVHFIFDLLAPLIFSFLLTQINI